MIGKTLYFAQHGLSLSKQEDSERPLSAEGILQTRSIARHLGKLEELPLQIFHSGKRRAEQTAEILATELSADKPGAIPLAVKQQSHMLPNDDIQLLIPELQDRALYVGHLPHLNKICSYLLCSSATSSIIRFQNSAILCLTLNDSTQENTHYQLNWYLTPSLTTGNRQ